MHGLAKRNDVARNLVAIWERKDDAGELDDDAPAVDLRQECEASGRMREVFRRGDR